MGRSEDGDPTVRREPGQQLSVVGLDPPQQRRKVVGYEEDALQRARPRLNLNRPCLAEAGAVPLPDGAGSTPSAPEARSARMIGEEASRLGTPESMRIGARVAGRGKLSISRSGALLRAGLSAPEGSAASSRCGFRDRLVGGRLVDERSAEGRRGSRRGAREAVAGVGDITSLG